ncbi:DUF1559 domain-containing protein [Stieleria mannarensis]|uniref:DUF1559 domain-containing protein n=1 Tax=Stieleria mannarensis TaxID=2755585 RepID=UPI0016024A8B
MNRSWNFIDASAVFVICVMTLSLLSIGVVRQRGTSRQSSCENNLIQIGVAFHNYHSAYKQLPFGSGGTDAGGIDQPKRGNAGRLSAFVAATPFMEEQKLWEMISNPQRNGSNEFPAMGPVPWFDEQLYTPWSLRPKRLVCPDDPHAKTFALASSYVMNYGDGVEKVFFGRGDWPNPGDTRSAMLARATQRGIFGKQKEYKFRDVLDGLSNTLMLAESRVAGPRVAKNVPGLPLDPSLVIKAQGGKQFWPVGREVRWCDGLLRSTGFQTILPPGSPSATSDQGDQTAVMSASSYHGRGTHVLFCDGAVRFVTHTIDAGDPSNPSVGLSENQPGRSLTPPGSKSPYGLWGALGTRANKEVVTIDTRKRGSGITEPRRQIPAEQLEAIRKKPIRTWTAAGGRSKMNGWLVSCTKEGNVVLVNEKGDEKYVTLSDLSGEDAYWIVQSLVAEKVQARDQLLDQMRDAVALLEKKEFGAFLTRFVDASQMSVQEVRFVSEFVFRKRGVLIQGFDDAIGIAQSGQVNIEVIDNRMLANFDDNDRNLRGNLVMHFSNDRWYWLPPPR